MSKATTRYLTKNVRLTFLKLLDDERNQRCGCYKFIFLQSYQYFTRILDEKTEYDSASEESGSDATSDILIPVPKKRAKKRR